MEDEELEEELDVEEMLELEELELEDPLSESSSLHAAKHSKNTEMKMGFDNFKGIQFMLYRLSAVYLTEVLNSIPAPFQVLYVKLRI